MTEKTYILTKDGIQDIKQQAKKEVLNKVEKWLGFDKKVDEELAMEFDYYNWKIFRNEMVKEK